MNANRCLVVLGMHRSGTSCLTGTVEQHGVYLGDVFTENPHNKKGNRESARVQALNNDLLDFNGGRWDKPVDVCHWNAGHTHRRDRIIDSIRSGAKDWWGFKDPRVMFAMSFWLESIETISFVGTFRHPHAVALSLQSRSGMTHENAYQLWLAYNLKLLALRKQFDIPLVDFDLSDHDYRDDVAKKLKTLGLSRTAGEEMFFSPELRNQSNKPPGDIKLPDEVEKVYEELKAAHAHA